MKRMRPFLSPLLAVFAAGAACAADTPEPKGYLSADRLPDAVKLLPAPPANGSPEAAADEATFRATRALADGPRWMVAQADAELAPAHALQRFDCAVGARLEAPRPKALVRLFTRVLGDVEAAWTPTKAAWKRPRPPAVDPKAPICLPRLKPVVDAPAYPSAHAAAGRAWALALAELAPDRSSAILARGDEIGASRVVCGVQWASDAAAGRALGEAVFAAERDDAAFKADLEAARAELAEIRKAAQPIAACAAEEDALKGAPAITPVAIRPDAAR
jgi:acid phosphatase (class A)